MTLKRHNDSAQRFNPYHIGVHEYAREDVDINEATIDELQENTDLIEILREAVGVHSFNTKPRDDFNNHPNNKFPQKADRELALPEGVDPHDAVLQLVQGGIRLFGFATMLSVDSSKFMVDRTTTDNMVEWIPGVGRQHNPDTGMVLFVERSEDEYNPRLHLLRTAISQLAVPSMTIITTAAPQEKPPLNEELCIRPDMLRPDSSDLGPGMDLL